MSSDVRVNPQIKVTDPEETKLVQCPCTHNKNLRQMNRIGCDSCLGEQIKPEYQDRYLYWINDTYFKPLPTREEDFLGYIACDRCNGTGEEPGTWDWPDPCENCRGIGLRRNAGDYIIDWDGKSPYRESRVARVYKARWGERATVQQNKVK